MDLVTRPPGLGPGAVPEATAPVAGELRALIDEVRALALVRLAPGERPLPPLPELRGGSSELTLERWLRAALGSGGLTPAALSGLVEDAFQRLAAAGAAGDARSLEAGRATAVRLLGVLDAAEGVAPSAAALGGVDSALVLRVLAEEVRSAVGRQIGAAPPFVAAPAAAEDPGNAGAALLGWLRAAAASAGVPLEALVPAIDAGTRRALEILPQARDSAALGATLAAASEVIARGLAVGGPPLVRPELPVAPAAVRRGAGARGGGERVAAIGEDEAPDPRRRRGRDGAEPEEHDVAEHPTEGPMQCIRRYVDAWLSGDPVSYAAQWVYPACFWIDGQWLGCADEAACAALHARLLRTMRGRGVAGGRILMLRVDPVSEAVALVHALVSEERADRSVMGEVERLYTTVRTPAGWRVAVAVTK